MFYSYVFSILTVFVYVNANTAIIRTLRCCDIKNFDLIECLQNVPKQFLKSNESQKYNNINQSSDSVISDEFATKIGKYNNFYI